MKLDDLPQAAVDALNDVAADGQSLDAWDAWFGARDDDGDDPRAKSDIDRVFRRMLAAALPHLIDDAMVDRGARALFAYQVKGNLLYPEGYDETYWTARVRPVLRAALGGDDA